MLFRERYNAERAEEQLRRLLEDPGIAKAAAAVGERVRAENGSASAADAIERGY